MSVNYAPSSARDMARPSKSQMSRILGNEQLTTE